MNNSRPKQAHSGRVATGETILTAARFADTSLVAARLAAFAEAHQLYADAQLALDTAEKQHSERNEALALLDAAINDAIEELVVRLITDRQPRNAPFEAYIGDSPSSLKSLRLRDKPIALGKLAAAVLRDESLSPQSREAAETIDRKAAEIVAFVREIEPLEAAVTEARAARDALVERWDTALAVLKRGVRAAEDDGAAGLYTGLFGKSRQRVAKKPKAPPQADVQAADAA